MNLILLDNDSPKVHWESQDSRTQHVRKVLKMRVGDDFFVGVERGKIGKAKILKDDELGMELEVTLHTDSPPPLPLHILIGLPRPQVARRLLRELPSLGPEKVTFFVAEKSEASYQQSSLWTSDEWTRLLREGAEQAFCTWTPEIAHEDSLQSVIETLAKDGNRVALDLYEVTGNYAATSKPAILAIGPEGGWTNKEREVLRQYDFQLQSMGERVMRVETAVIAAISIWNS
jgi:16S rRNA (uracil1498-N3)-methyltransferase